MNELISIIMPIYNMKAYLDQCIKSVVNQTYANLEIILVNDGSTDNSLEICNSWKEKDSRIIVITQKNGGVSDARNHGLQRATGKYVAFIDPDDVIHPSYIELLFTAIEATNTDIAICNYSKIEQNDMNIEYLEQPLNISAVMSNYEYACTLLKPSILTTVFPFCKIIKKEALANIQFVKGRLCEDNIFATDCINNALTCTVISNSLYYYRIVSNSISHSKSEKYYIDYCDSFLYQWNTLASKYDYRFQCRLYSKIANTISSLYAEVYNQGKADFCKLLYAKASAFILMGKKEKIHIGWSDKLKIFIFLHLPLLYCQLKKAKKH